VFLDDVPLPSPVHHHAFDLFSLVRWPFVSAGEAITLPLHLLRPSHSPTTSKPTSLNFSSMFILPVPFHFFVSPPTVHDLSFLPVETFAKDAPSGITPHFSTSFPYPSPFRLCFFFLLCSRFLIKRDDFAEEIVSAIFFLSLLPVLSVTPYGRGTIITSVILFFPFPIVQRTQPPASLLRRYPFLFFLISLCCSLPFSSSP